MWYAMCKLVLYRLIATQNRDGTGISPFWQEHFVSDADKFVIFKWKYHYKEYNKFLKTPHQVSYGDEYITQVLKDPPKVRLVSDL